MITYKSEGFFYHNGAPLPHAQGLAMGLRQEMGRPKTMAARILKAHDGGAEDMLHLRFDSLISHDITYVGILQTARASGLSAFPVPYAMTNCHNSLCAVGGTINEDDHRFGLSAAQKYGGIYVPANLSVIHQYARETMCRCGDMILGSDSHTRYGALGVMGIGEGGPEIVKQLLQNRYDLPDPQVVLVYLHGTPRPGTGPHDVALALCAALYAKGYAKNKVLEFAGPGVLTLPMDYRLGIDVMTTETACLSSIWTTDETVEAFYRQVGCEDAYRPLEPGEDAYYDACVDIDLARVEPMIALPFHPSNAYPIRTLLENPGDLLRETEREAQVQFGKQRLLTLTDKVRDGALYVDQGIIAGCAGGLYQNISEADAILNGASVGCGSFGLSVYPSSVPVSLALMESGIQQRLTLAGAVFKPAFCGPCFGAGDVPAHNTLSIRHTTRNFLGREGSRPVEGQLAAVALMDARSIAATAKNGGRLTAADEVEYQTPPPHDGPFDTSVYEKRVYNGFGHPQPDVALVFGPNIADWPRIAPLGEHLLMSLACVLHDAVTTTDELIPSGETSSYRSNPLRLAEFTLSRREPAYVPRAKAARALETARAEGNAPEALRALLARVGDADTLLPQTQVGSCLYAASPGDGSAREQAASCQRVLGGAANISRGYATKRYRSNCINWGLLPFELAADSPFPYAPEDWIFVPDIRRAVQEGRAEIPAKVITAQAVEDILLTLPKLDAQEREVLLAGCLMNHYARINKGENSNLHRATNRTEVTL